MDKGNIDNLQNDTDDKTKLSILRSELRRHIVTIQGFASVLKIELSASQHISENPVWVIHLDKMIEATNNMDEIIEILTG